MQGFVWPSRMQPEAAIHHAHLYIKIAQAIVILSTQLPTQHIKISLHTDAVLKTWKLISYALCTKPHGVV